MPNSFTFNSVDLSLYELVITSSNAHILSQTISTVQMRDLAYNMGFYRDARPLNFRVAVTGDSVADVISNLDNIKKTLGTEVECQLILDILTTRYFNAQLQSFDGSFISPYCWEGSASFLCPDPLGYAVTQTSSTYNIDADPKTITETVGGTGMVKPVYTLTAGETLTTVTIKLENITTNEELQWTGSLATNDELEIDVEHWSVKKNGVSAMTGLVLSSKFPRLTPGANSIKVTAFSTTGTLNILYRNTYS